MKPAVKPGGGNAQEWGCFAYCGLGDFHRINRHSDQCKAPVSSHVDEGPFDDLLRVGLFLIVLCTKERGYPVEEETLAKKYFSFFFS